MQRLPRVWFRQILSAFVLVTAAGWEAAGWAHGDYHEVLQRVQKELADSPDNADLHFSLAVAAQTHGDWAQALVSLEKTERLAPGKHPVKLVQGKALASCGQWQAAQTAFDAFLADHPGHATAHAERARTLLQLGKTGPALEDFRAAFESSPQPEPSWYADAATTLARLKRPSEAVALLNQGIGRAGPDPDLLRQAVQMETELGQFDSARTRLDALQKQSPHPESLMAEKARLMTQAGRISQARDAWQQLHAHLSSLPNLQRGLPENARLLAECAAALQAGSRASAPALSASPPATGRPHLAPVVAAPLPARSPQPPAPPVP